MALASRSSARYVVVAGLCDDGRAIALFDARAVEDAFEQFVKTHSGGRACSLPCSQPSSNAASCGSRAGKASRARSAILRQPHGPTSQRLEPVPCRVVREQSGVGMPLQQQAAIGQVLMDQDHVLSGRCIGKLIGDGVQGAGGCTESRSSRGSPREAGRSGFSVTARSNRG
jgi:hypothetical protein